MAISKFLHLFNPRLFIIVDRGMMWDWALIHLWLWQPIRAMREDLTPSMPGAGKDTSDGGCGPLSYVAINCWAAQLLRDNQEIMPRFVAYLQSKCRAESLPDDLAAHEAVAVEWLLLGLVELAPPGVRADQRA